MGDKVTFGATHEIEINGSRSWIKAEVTVTSFFKETADEVFERASKLVNTRIIQLIENAAAPLVEAEAKQKETS
jgi:hypothetical protein